MEDYIINRLNLFDDVICDLWGLNTCSYFDILNIALIIFRDLLDNDKLSFDYLKDRVFNTINILIESNL